jgi:copper resistance protein B
LLLTQRLILQPELEADVYGKDDPERRIGSGLSDIEAGLRLRYEVRRELAPYVGIHWVRRFGETADLAGNDSSDTRFVAGVRVWF